jgi:hypothetical protein
MTGTDLRAYVERARSAIVESDDLSLRNTELRLVQPFLDALGWDVRRPEVEADVAVPSDRGPVEYALRVDGRPAVFVDVRPCEAPLREADIDRLDAALDAAGVDWGILTNGRSFVFLARDGEETERLQCRLDELPDYEDAVSMYTKAAADSRPGPAADRRAAAERIAERRSAVAEAITETLVAAADGAAVADIADIADEFVDDLIVTLGDGDVTEDSVDAPATDESATEASGEADGAVNDETATETGGDASDRANRTGTASTASDSPTAGSDGRGVDVPETTSQTDDGQFVVRFFDGRTSVGAIGTGDHVGTTASAIEHLVDQYALDSRLSLPWRPDDSDDEGRAVLARRPVHPDGTEMRSYRRLSNDYCLLGTLDVDSAKTVVGELAAQTGMRVMFQGDW